MNLQKKKKEDYGDQKWCSYKRTHSNYSKKLPFGIRTD